MASVRKLPSGKWNATAYFKDPQTRKISRPSFTAPSKAEATRKAAEWEAQKALSSSSHDMLVKDCIDRYITVKAATISPSTLREYQRMQKSDYKAIDNLKISRLTNEDVQSFVSSLCEKHSPKSVRNIYGLFSSSFKMFSSRQLRVTLPPKKAIDYIIPTDDQVKLLMEKADPELRLNIALAAIGTLREGEIAALHYGDVDYENSSIHVHADMIRNADRKWIIKDTPKTSSSNRYIPLPKSVIDMIGTGEPDQRIYPHAPTSIYKAFVKLCAKNGMKFRFHDLRHYAASIMHALGIPDQYIMERGGWKSDAVLKAVYRNTISDQSAKFAQVANDHFSGLF